MSYITNADIENRLGAALYHQLADDDGDGVADVTTVDAVRTAAESEVDSYLARRFRTPIDTGVHPELVELLKTVTLDIAEMRLRAKRPPVPVATVRQHQATLIWLKDIATARADLPADKPVQTAVHRGPVADAFGEPRLLTRDELAEH